ncbi:MAG: alpha/beta fold hydrolase [Kurthia sp.]|nr:alpha/beta fold hydrolase [Candidatus Kurthia equi]
MYIKKKDQQFILEREITSDRLSMEWYNNVAKESFTVQSINGYDVPCTKINSIDSPNTVIIAHGVTETHINSFKYAGLFARLGYNIVVYDQRRHGNTAGKTTSYGYYEKNDLRAVVEKVREMIGESAKLGIQGESMGAATALLYGGTTPEQVFDFIVADCSFTSFKAQLHHVMLRDTPFRTPYPIKLIDFFVEKRDGYKLAEVAPIDVVQNIRKPVLFVHSLEDTYIPPSMSEELYQKKKEATRLVLFEKGVHAQSFNEQPKEYEETIQQFLLDFGMSSSYENIVEPTSIPD